MSAVLFARRMGYIAWTYNYYTSSNAMNWKRRSSTNIPPTITNKSQSKQNRLDSDESIWCDEMIAAHCAAQHKTSHDAQPTIRQLSTFRSCHTHHTTHSSTNVNFFLAHVFFFCSQLYTSQHTVNFSSTESTHSSIQLIDKSSKVRANRKVVLHCATTKISRK